MNDALWRDDLKTLFDPCPAGWRVPRCGDGELSPWSAFTPEHGPYNGIKALFGRLWDGSAVFGGTVWYPACGVRTPDSQGSVYYFGTGYYISTSTQGMRPARLRFDKSTVTPANYSGARCDGHSVRCVQE